MKDIVPAPPPIVRNDAAAVQALFQQNVVPSYGRFDIVLSHGSGSYVYDTSGKRYLDLGAGIAVTCLGHAHPAITEAMIEQSRKLVHVSNYYYHEGQGRLAQSLVNLIGPGKCFFCNSGGEANEGLFKLARKFGHDEGRFEILTTLNSFHGRTLAGIAATGQEKIKKGFEPMVPGFRQVPFNDLEAMRSAISPATAAILIEGVQGEGGVTPATAEYLLGLRRLCDEKRLLLLMDSVQCGHFRTGQFLSCQRILENGAEHLAAPAFGVPASAGCVMPNSTLPRVYQTSSGKDVNPAKAGTPNSTTPPDAAFMPDAVSMAKSLGGGFPVGAFWVRAPYADLLGAGTHGTTYGGSPLACAVALKILEVIRKEKLADNAREIGDHLKAGLQRLAGRYPGIIKNVRGLGLMLGVELAPDIAKLPGEATKTQSARFANLLHAAGLLTIPAGSQILRLLPALNLRKAEAEEGLQIVEAVVARLGS
jgi:acetylornithine aminotransferase/acetylornithine/N-succinyldiaminopimelate aminotransferase